ncbi:MULTISPECIES: hypothetical protein [Yersinia]|uniref:Uncharacterized protein n=1 Tax=Yersinia frederiksenii TaxID=29484 RepID=A0AAI8ZMI9_YERFR|nr:MULTISPECIES: hypothetical protein [Yersinia]MDN0126856.1 hypothetical protein [Yersinia massiliensis]CFQ88074.1 Uncharacterised protein [Yersinia frederiksenii]
MGGVSITEILAIIVVFFSFIFPMGKVFSKAGFHPAMCLLLLIPVVNIIALYYLAYAKWPNTNK